MVPTHQPGIPAPEEDGAEYPPEGWVPDPLGRHGERWISGGRPTALVRNGSTESQDPTEATLPSRSSTDGAPRQPSLRPYAGMVPPDFAAAGLAGSLYDHTPQTVHRRGAARRSGALAIAGVLGVLGLASIGFGVVRATTDVLRPGLPAGEAVATVEFQAVPHADAVGVWYPTQVSFSTADHRREVAYVTARERLGAQYPTAPTVVTISYDVRHPTNARLLYVGVSFLQSRSLAGPILLAIILWVLGGLLLFLVLRRPAIFDP